MLNHAGYEFNNNNGIQYRYKGTIDVTLSTVKWTADIFVNDVNKGAIKGEVTGIGTEDDPVRRAVDLAVKAAIQSLNGIDH
jgi:hypothetical protein